MNRVYLRFVSQLDEGRFAHGLGSKEAVKPGRSLPAVSGQHSVIFPGVSFNSLQSRPKRLSSEATAVLTVSFIS